MECQVKALLAAACLELGNEAFFAHAYAHRRQLERYLKHAVPKDEVAIEPTESVFVLRNPIVVVGGTAVVRFAVTHRVAYAYDEHSAIFLGYIGFAFFCGAIGIHLQQLLAVNKHEFFGQARSDVREVFVDFPFGFAHGTIDFLYSGF